MRTPDSTAHSASSEVLADCEGIGELPENSFVNSLKKAYKNEGREESLLNPLEAAIPQALTNSAIVACSPARLMRLPTLELKTINEHN